MAEPTSNDNPSLALPPVAKEVIRKIYELVLAGRALEAAAYLPQLEEAGRGNPTALKFVEGAALIDIGKELGDSGPVRRGISLLEGIEPASLQGPAGPAYRYNLGNAYGALYHARELPAGAYRALDEDFERAKEYYREAMAAGVALPQTRARLWTNYGILLRTVGRCIEEIEAYDEALKAVPGFAMALWHKAKGLCWYSNLVERPYKGSARQEARRLLKRSLKAGLEPGRRAKAEEDLAELDRILGQPKTSAHKHTVHTAHSTVERKYIKFCVQNRLYLHPCPVPSHEAYLDPLSVRFPTSVKGEFLELRLDPLALIKQEYIAARFLLFCYRLEQPDLSFIHRGTYLPSVERGNGQIYLQMLVLSFRATYAIMDKIAFFLNKFCRLGEEEDRVYFREELFVGHALLRPQLAKYDGPQLAALFDLAREFSKGQPLYPLRDLRRKLEHRCVTVRRAENSVQEKRASVSEGVGTRATQADDLDENDLYDDALRLLRTVRAAIFYLFYFVRRSVKPPGDEVS